MIIITKKQFSLIIMYPQNSQVKHTDDDRYDMVELGAAGESLIGPLRSATRMQHGFQSINPVAQCK